MGDEHDEHLLHDRRFHPDYSDGACRSPVPRCGSVCHAIEEKCTASVWRVARGDGCGFVGRGFTGAGLGALLARRGALAPAVVRSARGECGGGIERVLLAASVGRTLSPSASVVVLPKSDFHGFYC